MSRSVQRLLILDDSCELDSLEASELGRFSHLLVLCWMAPDTRDRLVGSTALETTALLEVVGGHRRWEQEANRLVQAVCEQGPARQGCPWRAFLAEPLFREACTVQAILDAFRLACERLETRGPCEVHLRIRADSEQLFRALAADTPLESTIRSAQSQASQARHRPIRHGLPQHRLPQHRLPQRIARRVHQVMLNGNWRDQALNLAIQADLDYRHRMKWGRWLPQPEIEPRGVTFFSSYLNNSRTLTKLEPFLPGGATWIVTSPIAKRGITGRRADRHDLWRFAPASLPDWVRLQLDREHFDLGEPDDLAHQERRIVEAWLRQSPTWRYWRGAGFKTLLNLTACWEVYLERARPRLVAVANGWGIEGWLAGIAKERGAAVVELLHGVVGGPFFTEGPLVADALIVWGRFWREQRPEHQRSRIHVFNPGITATRPTDTRPTATAKPARPRVTYFSWPLDRSHFYPVGELLDGFVDIFQRVTSERRCQLTIRGHPLENLTDLTQRWQQRFTRLPSGVQLSQHEPLAEVLRDTDIAIMFRSTVLLDCLACDIPVLIPGWIDFGWNESLDDVPGVRLVEDFADLEQSLAQWLDTPPGLDRRRTHHFLRPAGEGEAAFRAELARLLEAGPKGGFEAARASEEPSVSAP